MSKGLQIGIENRKGMERVNNKWSKGSDNEMIIRKGQLVQFIHGRYDDEFSTHEGTVLTKDRKYSETRYWIRDAIGKIYKVEKWQIIKRIKVDKIISQKPTYPKPNRRD